MSLEVRIRRTLRDFSLESAFTTSDGVLGLSRIHIYPPAAAPRAQCLCPRVSGTVPGVLPGRHGRFCVARSAHGEAENRAVQPPARAGRTSVAAPARN